MNPALAAAAFTLCLGAGLYGIAMIRTPGVERLHSVAEGGPARRRGRLGRALDSAADRLAPRATRLLVDERLRDIRRTLDAAGRPGGMTIEAYAGHKALNTVLFGTIGVLLALQGRPFIGTAVAVGGFYSLDLSLRRTARRRRERIDRDLPDFLDILAVTVSAGVAFRSALERVAEAVGGPLGDEVVTTLRQMDLGATRRDAFQALRGRTSSEFLGQFVTALLQAEELGVPLAGALENLATEMRQTFYQEARRGAARAAPRVSLIVSLVIVPGAVMLILGGLFVGGLVDVGGPFGG
jgi:tight adherence protein C